MRRLRVAVTCVAAQRLPRAYESSCSPTGVNQANTRPQTNAMCCTSVLARVMGNMIRPFSSRVATVLNELAHR